MLGDSDVARLGPYLAGGRPGAQLKFCRCKRTAKLLRLNTELNRSWA